jgi:imidazolonepropionase
MLFVLHLGVFTLGLTVEEAINACTANAACAVGRQAEIGSLEPGKKMDLLLCAAPARAHLAYELGINPVRHIIKNGRLVVRDARRT